AVTMPLSSTTAASRGRMSGDAGLSICSPGVADPHSLPRGGYTWVLIQETTYPGVVACSGTTFRGGPIAKRLPGKLRCTKGNWADARGTVMNSNGQVIQQLDVLLFERNRPLIPQKDLEPYAGQWVAISGDGTRVLASGPDLATAEANLAALGIPGNAV